LNFGQGLIHTIAQQVSLILETVQRLEENSIEKVQKPPLELESSEENNENEEEKQSEIGDVEKDTETQTQNNNENNNNDTKDSTEEKTQSEQTTL